MTTPAAVTAIQVSDSGDQPLVDQRAVEPELARETYMQLGMTGCDASAVLALSHDKPGAGMVAAEIGAASLVAVNLTEVLTADRAWADLDLPVRVRLIR